MEDLNDNHSVLLNDLQKGGTKRPKRSNGVRILPETSQNISLDTAIGHLGKDIQHIAKDLETLEKPLEKPISKRIARASGFEKVAIEASRYESIVHRRRKADFLSFPIQRNDISILTSEKSSVPEMKTSLEKKVYTMLYGEDYFKEQQEISEQSKAIEKAMSMKEIEQKSRHIWREKMMRIRLEQKIAHQNKSKSKTNRRVNRKSKLAYRVANDKHMTEDEIRIEEDKQRVTERISLRHRNSRWVTRQKKVNSKMKMKSTDLDQANILSQNLTAKTPLSDNEEVGAESDGSDDDVNFKDIDADEFMKHFQKNNPWLDDKDGQKLLGSGKNVSSNSSVNRSTITAAAKYAKEKKKRLLTEKKKKSSKINGILIETTAKVDIKSTTRKKKLAVIKKDEKIEKLIADVNERKKSKDLDIDDLFDTVEMVLSSEEVSARESKLKQQSINNGKNSNRLNRRKSEIKNMKKMKQEEKPEFDFTIENDEELLDERRERIAGFQLDRLGDGDYIWETNNEEDREDRLGSLNAEESNRAAGVVELDVAKLSEETPKLFTPRSHTNFNRKFDGDVDDSDEDMQTIIQDAFKDDYIMEEFKDEKAKGESAPSNESDRLKGWGYWSGAGINEEVGARKKDFRPKHRHIRNKKPIKKSVMGNVIYNVKSDLHENIRNMMVQKIPYPFKSIKEYEASIRAPCGRMYVPELVHQRLIKPSIKTKIGTVIDPMGEDQLLKGDRKNREEKKKWKENLKKKLEEKLKKNKRVKL